MVGDALVERAAGDVRDDLRARGRAAGPVVLPETIGVVLRHAARLHAVRVVGPALDHQFPRQLVAGELPVPGQVRHVDRVVHVALVLVAVVGEGPVRVEALGRAAEEPLALVSVAGLVEHARREFHHEHVVHVHVGVADAGGSVAPQAVRVVLELRPDPGRGLPLRSLARRQQVGVSRTQQQIRLERGDEGEAVDVGVVPVHGLAAGVEVALVVVLEDGLEGAQSEGQRGRVARVGALGMAERPSRRVRLAAEGAAAPGVLDLFVPGVALLVPWPPLHEARGLGEHALRVGVAVQERHRRHESRGGLVPRGDGLARAGAYILEQALGLGAEARVDRGLRVVDAPEQRGLLDALRGGGVGQFGHFLPNRVDHSLGLQSALLFDADSLLLLRVSGHIEAQRHVVPPHRAFGEEVEQRHRDPGRARGQIEGLAHSAPLAPGGLAVRVHRAAVFAFGREHGEPRVHSPARGRGQAFGAIPTLEDPRARADGSPEVVGPPLLVGITFHAHAGRAAVRRAAVVRRPAAGVPRAGGPEVRFAVAVQVQFEARVRQQVASVAGRRAGEHGGIHRAQPLEQGQLLRRGRVHLHVVEHEVRGRARALAGQEELDERDALHVLGHVPAPRGSEPRHVERDLAPAGEVDGHFIGSVGVVRGPGLALLGHAELEVKSVAARVALDPKRDTAPAAEVRRLAQEPGGPAEVELAEGRAPPQRAPALMRCVDQGAVALLAPAAHVGLVQVEPQQGRRGRGEQAGQ